MNIFAGFCLRIAEDFETSLDDWKPNREDSPQVMNACVVPEGTYEVCSRTTNPQSSGSLKIMTSIIITYTGFLYKPKENLTELFQLCVINNTKK